MQPPEAATEMNYQYQFNADFARMVDAYQIYSSLWRALDLDDLTTEEVKHTTTYRRGGRINYEDYFILCGLIEGEEVLIVLNNTVLN